MILKFNFFNLKPKLFIGLGVKPRSLCLHLSRCTFELFDFACQLGAALFAQFLNRHLVGRCESFPANNQMISQRGLDDTNIEPFEPQSLNAIIGAFPDKYPFDEITQLHKLSKSFEHQLMLVKLLPRQNRRFAQGYPNFDGALDARIKPDFIDHIQPDLAQRHAGLLRMKLTRRSAPKRPVAYAPKWEPSS